jgi:hypothetical protein
VRKLTREEEEQFLFDKIVALKRLYEEVDNLVKSGYDGPFIGEEIRPLMEAYFKAKWGNKNADIPNDLQADEGRQDAGVDGGGSGQQLQDDQRAISGREESNQ